MLLGISGLAGSGKDTVADFLVKDYRFVKVALADPLKRICKDVFQFSDEQLWGPSEKRNEPDARFQRCASPGIFTGSPLRCVNCGVNYDEPHLGPLTPRHALQQLGTEWGRACYGNIWVDYALRVAKKLLTLEEGQTRPYHPFYYSARNGLWAGENLRFVDGVVIPDCRFKNEFEAIRKEGGKLWRVKRGTGLEGAASQHRSETEQQEVPDEYFDAIVYNDSTIEALQMRVEYILKEMR